MRKYLISFLLLISVFNILGCNNEIICLEGIDNNFILTEQQAIFLSKTALEKVVLDISQYEPVPYRSGELSLFARNRKNKNSGYVLWHEKGKKTIFEYSVSIEKKGTKIYCDAGRTL